MFYRSAAFVLAALLAAGEAGALASERQPLSATTLDGARFSLAAESGKVVIINFWATWCAPCRVEMPALDSYYRAHHQDGLDMVAISIDADGSKRRIREAASQFSFPVARLADTRIARRDIPTGLPVTRIYGRDGMLRFDSTAQKGAILDRAALERIVAPLLAERSATTR